MGLVGWDHHRKSDFIIICPPVCKWDFIILCPFVCKWDFIIICPFVCKWEYNYTVQAATGVPPGCVLSIPRTCIQMRLITTTFHRKIGHLRVFASICGHLRSTTGSLVMLWCAVVSHDITQPCMVAPFTFNAATICVLPHLCQGISNQGLAQFFYSLLWEAFIFSEVSCSFNCSQLR